MNYSQHLKRCFLASIIYVLATIITPAFSCVTVSTALASSSQEGFFTDSTPYLVGYPSQLNETNCQASNNQTWTCVVTLYGYNIVNLVVWNASTSYSSISISPSKGYLAKLVPSVKVTISNIPCMNTSFLFSGQVYGGGGVIPTTIPWSCIQQPTSTPTAKASAIAVPTAVTPVISTPKPKPTSIVMVPTSTHVATIIPRPTSTITSPPTSVISSSSHSDPPIKGNGDSSVNMFMASALISILLVTFTALVVIVLIKRHVIFKRP